MYEVKCEECGVNNIVCKCREDSRPELTDLLVILKYHEDAAREGREDYVTMCEDGDDIDICGAFLSLVEQHEKFAAMLRVVIGN